MLRLQGNTRCPPQQHSLLAVLVLATNVSALASLNTPDAQTQSTAALATLDAICVASEDGTPAAHEKTGAVAALLSHCEHARQEAALSAAAGGAGGGQKGGEHKKLVLQAFSICSKEDVQKQPLLTIVLRELGQALVHSGCALAVVASLSHCVACGLVVVLS